MSTSPSTNYGTDTALAIGENNNATNKISRALLKFDLSSIPANATITSATLSLWTAVDYSDNDRTIRVYRLKVPFDEMQATWNVSATGVNWQSAGASGANDRESVDIGSVQVLADEAIGMEKQISLSPAKLQEFVNGSFTNNGFILVADTELNDRFNYKSSDASVASNHPKLMVQYTLASQTPTATPAVTNTPTLTPTPTATSAPSFTPTATPPSVPISVNASFVYDGDGNRVAQTLNGVTTYFIGNYYEVQNPGAGQTVTKYYYAGSQRVAMRTNGTLYYMLSDHLGSTSLTTDANGNVLSELRYSAWGEVRYSAGRTPTQYTYTGQRSYTDSFGLMYYGARWLDVSLGRFAQADSIVPGGVQGYDRYAYADNNPVRYTDPTGHMVACGVFGAACEQDGSINGGNEGDGDSLTELSVPDSGNTLQITTNNNPLCKQVFSVSSCQIASKVLGISVIIFDSTSLGLSVTGVILELVGTASGPEGLAAAIGLYAQTLNPVENVIGSISLLTSATNDFFITGESYLNLDTTYQGTPSIELVFGSDTSVGIVTTTFGLSPEGVSDSIINAGAVTYDAYRLGGGDQLLQTHIILTANGNLHFNFGFP